MTILRTAIGLAALASLAAPATASACDMHGGFDDGGLAYYSYRDGQLTDEEIRRAELAAAEARDLAMASAREAFLSRFAVKVEAPADAAPVPISDQTGSDADRRTRTDASYR